MTDQPRRFIPLADVCETSNISSRQGYALLMSGDIPAIQIGGRGMWRIEVGELDGYIQRQYAATRAKIAEGDHGLDVSGE